MKVLVTGASGFIGSHVTPMLLNKGHQVAIMALPGDPMGRLQAIRSHLEIIHTNLEDVGLVERGVKAWKPDACIHLAWYVEPGNYLDSAKNLQSVSSSLSLFQILIEAGCSQIVAAGTCLEYDTDFGYFREDTPTRPRSLYGAAKLSCCLMGSQLATKAKTKFAWGRVFYPYGPREDERRLVTAAIAAIKQGLPFPATHGAQIRDYIHVADVAAAFCLLLEKGAEDVFNISTGSPVSIRELLEMLGQLMNRADLIQMGGRPYREFEPAFICGSNTRLKSLGWQPFYSLSAGLSNTISSIV